MLIGLDLFCDTLDAQLEEHELRVKMDKKTKKVYTNTQGKQVAYIPIV